MLIIPALLRYEFVISTCQEVQSGQETIARHEIRPGLQNARAVPRGSVAPLRRGRLLIAKVGIKLKTSVQSRINWTFLRCCSPREGDSHE